MLCIGRQEALGAAHDAVAEALSRSVLALKHDLHAVVFHYWAGHSFTKRHKLEVYNVSQLAVGRLQLIREEGARVGTQTLEEHSHPDLRGHILLRAATF